MKIWIFLWSMASCAGAVAGCGGDSAPVVRKGTYTLRLFAPSLAGRRLELKLREPDASLVLHRYTGSLDPAGQRTITAPMVLETGRTYWVEYYVDLDGDGSYTPPSGMGFVDPSWRRIVMATEEDARAGFSDSATSDDPRLNIAPF